MNPVGACSVCKSIAGSTCRKCGAMVCDYICLLAHHVDCRNMGVPANSKYHNNLEGRRSKKAA